MALSLFPQPSFSPRPLSSERVNPLAITFGLVYIMPAIKERKDESIQVIPENGSVVVPVYSMGRRILLADKRQIKR